MKKSIFLVSIFLCSSWMVSLVHAQEWVGGRGLVRADDKVTGLQDALKRATGYKELDKEPFHFPSVQEANQVFQTGKRLMDNYQNQKILPNTTPANFSHYRQAQPDAPIYTPSCDEETLLKKIRQQRIQPYQEFYKHIRWTQPGKPDLSHPDTMRAYLAFLKLIQYQGNPMSVPTYVGRIDERFALLGVYAESFQQLNQQFGEDPRYLWLQYQLAQVRGRNLMIPAQDAQQAEEAARQLLYRDFQSYGLNQKQADQWLAFAVSFSSPLQQAAPKAQGATVTILDQGNWYCSVVLSATQGQECSAYNAYKPFALTALHEFLHVKEMFPGRAHTETDTLNELSTSIQDIVLADQIYRTIHKTPQNTIVTYAHAGGFGVVNLGEMAVFFRQLTQTYHSTDYAALLQTPQAQAYIQRYYDAYMEQVGTMLVENQGQNPTTKSKEQLRKLGEEFFLQSLKQNFQM